MKTICFTVPGKPQGKARARTFYNPKTQGMSSVTPEKTVLYENFISTCYLQIAGEERFEDTAYIRIRIQAFFEVPKSSSKVKKEAMLNGEILPAKKPDIDNIAKAVLDALNSVAYRDDTQVVELQLRKQYSEKPRVKEEIMRLKQEHLNREFLSEADIFQKYMDIAFADITDYMTFGTEEVPVIAMYGPVKIKDPETGEEKQLTKIVNTVRFKDSSEVDGTILSEVKQGKDGASIKLSDRMKALQWLSDHMDMATEEQKAKIAQMKAQTERLAAAPTDGEEDGVEIINDADEKAGQNIRDSDSKISSGI